jgi:hypothetical protein
MERARRYLTLDTEHEHAIRYLCSIADSAVWNLKNGSEDERYHIAEKLEAAWKAVSHEVMP